jgi:hypothetical protein
MTIDIDALEKESKRILLNSAAFPHLIIPEQLIAHICGLTAALLRASETPCPFLQQRGNAHVCTLSGSSEANLDRQTASARQKRIAHLQSTDPSAPSLVGPDTTTPPANRRANMEQPT